MSLESWLVVIVIPEPCFRRDACGMNYCVISYGTGIYLVIPLDLRMKNQADLLPSIAPNTTWLLRKSVINALGVSTNNNNTSAAIIATVL